MSGLTDVTALLRAMKPELHPGRYVFTTAPDIPADVHVVACVREEEGMSLVTEQSAADGMGLPYDYVAAMITLRVHSSLHAVGLTAAVARALAQAGLSCNVVAGTHHDHLFVPHDQGARAVEILEQLSAAAK
jgi:hypothetical protein